MIKERVYLGEISYEDKYGYHRRLEREITFRLINPAGGVISVLNQGKVVFKSYCGLSNKTLDDKLVIWAKNVMLREAEEEEKGETLTVLPKLPTKKYFEEVNNPKITLKCSFSKDEYRPEERQISLF